jgi:hypothetical protein
MRINLAARYYSGFYPDETGTIRPFFDCSLIAKSDLRSVALKALDRQNSARLFSLSLLKFRRQTDLETED